nr:WYL domain-containing protein [Eubacteriales bacterium]
MAYSELIKNFNRIRDYMREFYVYGFKSRNEYNKKSARSYDDERRRLESWLGDHMQFRQTPEGKTVFLSIDSRVSHHNPLYAAWKAKSFTDGDITLHFILLDILYSPNVVLSLNEITDAIDGYLASFGEPRIFDSSTVRKKLNEYMSEGIVVSEKHEKTMYYRRADSMDYSDSNALDFFSEVAPCGVIGSYLLDKLGSHDEHFAFKHHYITGAMDSEIICMLFSAMSEKRSITMETINRHKDRISETHVIPLRIMISVQSGRQYLMAYAPRFKRITSFRIDNIVSVKLDEVSERFDELREKLDGMLPHMWGVSTQNTSGERIEHVEFTVKYADHETHIHRRLEREKRCGTVERIDDHTSRFSADVFDASELVPWIRTFICRITEYSFSNKALESQFRDDIEEMYRLYGIEGG